MGTHPASPSSAASSAIPRDAGDASPSSSLAPPPASPASPSPGTAQPDEGHAPADASPSTPPLRSSDEAREGDTGTTGAGETSRISPAPSPSAGDGDDGRGGSRAERLPASGGPLASLRHRNFRLFYGGQVLSLVGTWMQTTAQGWLVLQLTDSAFLLGLVTAAGSLPTLLFTLYAGVVADRYEKRRILLVSNAMSLVAALALGVLTDTEAATVPLLLALVFAAGTASAFEVPTRQAFFAELVGREDLPNAIALNSSAFNGTRVVGPAIAGAVMAALGVAACFYVNAASFFFVIAGLLAMRLPRFVPPARTGTALEHIREGLAYVRGERLVRALIWTVAAMSILVFPSTMLLPVFARDVLHAGASGLGWLLSASGAGALASAILLAGWGGRLRRGRTLVWGAVAYCLFLAGFALSEWFALSLALQALAGFCLILTTATANALIQSTVPNHLRGRVMSVYVFMFLGMAPLGSLQAGWLARVAGAPQALALGAAAMLAVLGYVTWRVPEVRRAR